MLIWLSRCMIFIFLFSVIAPEVAEAKRNARASLQQAVLTKIEAQKDKPLSQARSADELDMLYAVKMIGLADVYDSLEVTDAISTHNTLAETVEQMHRTTKEYTRLSKMFAEEAQKKDSQPEDPFVRPLPPPVADNTYRPGNQARQTLKQEQLAAGVTVNKFLKNVSENNLSVVDLVNELDPLTPPEQVRAGYQVTAYSAEIILNTLNTLSSKQDAADWMDFLPRLQQRAQYRLQHIPADDSLEETIMARNTLLMLLAKINQVYTLAGRKDPLAADISRYPDIFVTAVNMLKDNKKTKPGSREFQFLKLQTEYAVRYALLGDQPGVLERLVKTLEQAPKAAPVQWVNQGQKYTPRYIPTKFQTTYSEILGTLFATTAETLKIYPLKKSTTDKTLEFLVKMAGTDHATDTRVLAIGTAALLNKSTSAFSAHVQAQLKGRATENFYEFTPKQREVLARYAVDIYWPLNESAVYGPTATYGLDSKQMQALSNSLVSSIRGLLPVTAPQTVWSQTANRYQANPSLLITLKDFEDQKSYDKNANVLTRPTYMFGSDGQIHPVYVKNALNPSKVRQEDEKVFVRIVGEAALWIGGGMLISSLFRALRMTTGAISFLPQAVKVASKAKKGQRLGRFTAKMRQGWKYSASVERTLARGGASVVTTRTEQVAVKASQVKPAPANAPALGAGATASKAGPKTFTMDAPVTRSGTGYVGGLTNQKGSAGFGKRFSQWLTGKTPQAQKYTLFGQRPGFQFASAELDATALGLQNGIRSPLQKARFYRAAQQQGIQLTPLTWEERSLLAADQQFIGAVGDALGFDATSNAFNAGTFDYWAYNGTRFERITPQDFFTRAQHLADHATLSAEGAALTDYYGILKVSPKASAAEIKGAYHSLAKELHPDKVASLSEAQRKLAEEQFKQVGEAYKVLSNKTSRAAYDLKLANKPLVNMFAPQMPVSPEGFSLAVSPKTGLFPGEVPAGFDPIAQAGGMGLNAQNVSGDLASQFAQHLMTTEQFPQLGGLLIKNNALFNMFKSNVIFFAAWDLLDRASYALQQPMINSAAEKQVQQELDRYGDMFKTKPGDPAENAPRLDVLEKVANSENNPLIHQGALITLPIYATRLATGNLNLVSDEIKTLLSINAKRIDLAQALNNQAQSGFRQDAAAVIAGLNETRSIYESDAQQDPPEIKPLRQKIFDVLDRYMHEVQAATNSQQLSQAIQTNEPLLNQAMEAFSRANNKFDIQSLQEGKADWSDAAISTNLKKEVQAIYDRAIAGLRKADKQKDPNDMLTLRAETLQQFQTQIEAFYKKAQQPSKTWNEMTPKEQKQALRQDWQDVQEIIRAQEADFQIYGDKAVAEYKQLAQQANREIEDIFKSSLTPQEQADRYYARVDQLANDLYTLLNGYAIQAASELDELLPQAH